MRTGWKYGEPDDSRISKPVTLMVERLTEPVSFKGTSRFKMTAYGLKPPSEILGPSVRRTKCCSSSTCGLRNRRPPTGLSLSNYWYFGDLIRAYSKTARPFKWKYADVRRRIPFC